MNALAWIIAGAAAVFIGAVFGRLVVLAAREVRQYRAFARQTRSNRISR